MKTKKIVALLLVLLTSVQAWSYRITDNYTVEVKFRINALAAGIIFANYNGYNGDFYMWQYNASSNKFRPHHWYPGACLEEKDFPAGLSLNTEDWFVTTIEVTNGNHADTYLRRADSDVDVLIDSREGNFRFGMIGFRQDHDGDVNESASYDYVKVTDENGKVLYFDDFEGEVSWQENPVVADGVLTAEGRDLSERRYRPNNMFKDAVDMHYAVDADLAIEEGYLSVIFGMGENGSNYMWQISPNYYNDGSVNIYYHLDNGNENWKAHAAGQRFPEFAADDFKTPRHLTIKVDANVVETYVDGKLQDSFVQCDMTDLELLNAGRIGFRADGGNNIQHKGTVDNVKVTNFDAEGNVTDVTLYDNFSGNLSRYFDDAEFFDFIAIENNQLSIDVPAGEGHALRIVQSDEAVNPLVLDENEDNTLLPTLAATDVRFDRTFKANTWNTLCVPFSLTAEQVQALLGEGAKVAALETFNEAATTFEFATQQTVEALVPYLVYPTQDVEAGTALTVGLVEGEAGVCADQSGYAFSGILAPKPFVAGDKTTYFVGEGNQLCYPSTDSSLKAFRCYFTVPEGAAEAKYHVDGETTAIEEVQVASPATSVAYDLQGRSVKAPAKGVYVIDGKKVIF